MRNKFVTITCPVCGKEYLPAEIYIPKYFLGSPHNIERDKNNKIIGYSGCGMDECESYICDNCGEEFYVVAKLSFITSVSDDINYYSTKLKKDEKVN